MVMASIIISSNYSLLFSSRSPSILPISSKFPVSSPMIHSRRQHPVVFKEKSSLLGFSGLIEKKGLGLGLGYSTHFLHRSSCFGSVRRRCNKGWGSDEGDFALEMEILEFMDMSENPNKFPTKKDLIKAGRFDLVEAIEKNRDWLSKGWDLDEEEEEIVQENEIGSIEELNSGVENDSTSDFLHSDDRISQERFFNGGEYDSLEGVAAEDSSSHPSSSGREMGKEEEEKEGGGEEDDAGIHGILRRLEKDRNLSFGFGSREKETDTDLSCKNDYEEDDWKLGSSMFSDSKPASTTSLKPSNDSYIVTKATGFGEGSISDFDNMENSLQPDTWRAWSIQRQHLSQNDFEAAEFGTDVATDNTLLQKNANETGEERAQNVQTDKNWFRSRVQHLELELASTLRSLKSAAEVDISSLKVSESPLAEEFLELSDAWEFQETEIMNAKNKLRSIRANMAILEGKIALAAIESQKNLEMKQKRINDAGLALSTLRNACIVWPSSALVVLVCGSFDGWSSQRMMEKSSSGFFTLNLKLYPGRYEFKFIVDGVWKIDLLRPIARHNGYENNVMVIS